VAESEALAWVARGDEGLLEAVSFKKATESVGRGRVANARWERVPHSGGCNTKTTGGKDSVNTRNTQQVSWFSHTYDLTFYCMTDCCVMYWKEGCWAKEQEDKVNRRLIRIEELHRFLQSSSNCLPFPAISHWAINIYLNNQRYTNTRMCTSEWILWHHWQSCLHMLI